VDGPASRRRRVGAAARASARDQAEIKRRIAGSTRTDETDSAGMLILLANGTFPEVWMAPPMVRDLRGLVRTRLAIRRQESAMKNRVHGVLNQYGLKNSVEEEDDVGIHDWFSRKAQEQLQRAIEQLPPASREATRQQWMAIQDLERRVKSLELAMEARMGKLGWLRLLQTLPGVGKILGATIWVEIGEGKRFPSAQHLARYAGVVVTALGCLAVSGVTRLLIRCGCFRLLWLCSVQRNSSGWCTRWGRRVWARSGGRQREPDPALGSG
jgi:transposase